MAGAPANSLKWLLFLILGAPVLAIGLVLSAAAEAKGTGYVFVSHEKTNNIAVIDPKHDYKIIKWIQTSRRSRDMKFRDSRRLLYVACGDDVPPLSRSAERTTSRSSILSRRRLKATCWLAAVLGGVALSPDEVATCCGA